MTTRLDGLTYQHEKEKIKKTVTSEVQLKLSISECMKYRYLQISTVGCELMNFCDNCEDE